MRLIEKDMSPYNGAYYPTFNPVLLIDSNGLYKTLLDNVYNHLKKTSSTPSGVYDGLDKKVVNDYFRSSSFCKVSNKVYADVAERINTVVDWQLSFQANSRKYALCEGLQFLRYDAANQGKFLSHTDNAYFDSGGKFLYTSPQRVITTVTFVNDDFEGGEVVFENIKDDSGNSLVVTPKAGHTVIFPSDIRYPHEVRPVTKGVRYSIVGWYGLDDL